jgi:hypothetical protein
MSIIFSFDFFFKFIYIAINIHLSFSFQNNTIKKKEYKRKSYIVIANNIYAFVEGIDQLSGNDAVIYKILQKSHISLMNGINFFYSK